MQFSFTFCDFRNIIKIRVKVTLPHNQTIQSINQRLKKLTNGNTFLASVMMSMFILIPLKYSPLPQANRREPPSGTRKEIKILVNRTQEPVYGNNTPDDQQGQASKS